MARRDLRGFAAYVFKLSRPRFWLYLAGPVIVGVVYAADSIAALFSPTSLALFAYFLIPGNVYLYGINDIFDADIDQENPKKEDKEVRYRGSVGVIAIVIASGLALGGLIPFVNREALRWLGLFFVLATEYSAPPFRFKTTPFLDSVSNGLYVLPGAAAYTAIAGQHPPLVAVAGAWLWTMGMHTFSAIPDIEADRAGGIRTTATVLGEDRTYTYCAVTWLGAAVLFALLDPRLSMPLFLYPVLVFAIVRSDVDVDRAYWWYPAVNSAVGMLLTLGGLWRLVYG